MKRAQSKIRTVPSKSADIIIMPNSVFWANSGKSEFEIYRRKVKGKWVFKAVQEEKDGFPFLYPREAAKKETLMDEDGWYNSFDDALEESPLDIWLNYIDMVMHHTYADKVGRKIVAELDEIHFHLAWMVEHCKKHRRTSCN